METIIVMVIIVIRKVFTVAMTYCVFPCSRPYVKNKHFTYALFRWFLIKFGTSTRIILILQREETLRLKEVSNLFIIVHLAHGGTWLLCTSDGSVQVPTVFYRRGGLSGNCKQLHSTCHGQELANAQSS